MGVNLVVAGVCVVAVLVVLGAVLLRRLEGGGAAGHPSADESELVQEMPYCRRMELLGRDEREFLEALEVIVHGPLLAEVDSAGERGVGSDVGGWRGGLAAGPFGGDLTADGAWARVFVQVPLASVVDLPPETARGQFWRDQIDRRTIDFVLCEAGTLRPMLAIELDAGGEHERMRDIFVEEVLCSAGLPLVRWRLAGGYSREELAEVVMGEVERSVIG